MSPTNKLAVNHSPIQREEIENSIDRFSALLRHATNLAFPVSKDSTFEKIYQSNWPGIRKFFYFNSLPLQFDKEKESSSSLLIKLMWLIAFFIWTSIFIAFLTYIFDPNSIGNDSNDLSIPMTILLYFNATIGLIFIPFSYWSWVEFFLNKRMRKVWKLLLFLLYVVLNLAILFIKSDNGKTILLDELSVPINLKLTVVIFLIAIIPVTTFLYLTFLSFIPSFFGSVTSLIRFISSSHSPWLPETILTLISDRFVSLRNENVSWQLQQLNDFELKTIRQWAEKNRESTDKKLLPTTLIFAFFGLFTDSMLFDDFLTKFLTWLPGSLWISSDNEGSFDEIVNFYAALAVLLIFWKFVTLIGQLIKNIVAQSLIVEACIIVEHSLRISSEKSEERNQNDTFGSLVVKFFRNLIKTRFENS